MLRSATIIRVIESEILSGQLAAGEKLESEEQLCERFGVSRTVIREAIQQLRGRGLLRSLKGSGTYIAEPSLTALGNVIEVYSVLAEDADFLELIDFRILLETECAMLAARHAGEAILRDLRVILNEMKLLSTDRVQFSRQDIAFHLCIARGSSNRLYATVLGALEKSCIAYAQKNRGDGDWYAEVIATHEEIYLAIEASKAERAAEAMRKHLLSSRRHFVDLEPEDAPGGDQENNDKKHREN